jgi:hypothetical protein
LGRQGIDHDGSTAAADAAQALVNFFVVAPHLLQRSIGLVSKVGSGLRFAASATAWRS